MKIALSQRNYHVGNFDENASKIINDIRKARENQADLVVFSELSVCGYPPRDFLEQKDFIAESEKTVQRIAKECIGIAAIVGAPRINPDPSGKKLFNAAFLLADGKIQSIHNKTLLPTYDIFDEYRYFEPNNEFSVATIGDKRLAITICEDLWDSQPVETSFAKNKLYKTSPMKKLMEQKPDFIINIAASPFSYSQENKREKVLVENAKHYGLPVFYVNQIGANTELIFDGDSMVIDKNGNTVKKLVMLAEDMQFFDTEKIEKGDYPGFQVKKKPDMEKIHDALVLGVRDYFAKSNLQSAVLGLSGGIDSAVTAAIAVEALGSENVRGILMPSKYSSEHSITDAVKLAENLKIKYDIISIREPVAAIEKMMRPLFAGLQENIAEENIQARIRAVIVMAVSNKFGNILLNTSNKSEAAVGYGTLYGDMCGGLSIIGDVYKTEVYRLARYINREAEIIPKHTIIKPPSAELKPDQKDTDSLPEYAVLDEILFQFIELKQGEEDLVKQGYDRKLIQKVIRMVNSNEFKRFQAPPILRISTKAFGMGRRMPIVAKY